MCYILKLYTGRHAVKIHVIQGFVHTEALVSEDTGRKEKEIHRNRIA